MKKQLLALAALAAVSGVAAAQNVTVFGVVDGGLQYLNKTTSAGAAQTSYLNGGTSPSILGFKGSEDLGGGLKANFALEGHLSTANGAAGDWDGTFGRQANVGLSGSFGALTLGKQYTPAVLAFASTDPRGLKETNSGLMTWAFSASTNNAVIDVFARNAVSYNVSGNGFGLGALYSLGGVAGDSSAGSVVSLGLTYANGPLSASGAYQTANGTTAGDGKVNQKSSVGIAYNTGALTVKVNYMLASKYNATSGAKTVDNEVWGVGANYAWNAANTLTAAAYIGKNKIASTSNGKSYILSNDTALSKRTTVYGLVGIAQADASVDAGSMAIHSYVAGTTVNIYQVGIKHAF